MFNPFEEAAKAIGRAAEDTAKAAAREAERAAQEAERLARVAAQEAEQAAQQAAREAERIAREAARETETLVLRLAQEAEKINLTLSASARSANRALEQELARFGGDVESAMRGGRFQELATQFSQQFVADNEAQLRRIGQTVTQIQRSGSRQAALSQFINDLRRGRPKSKADVQRLLRQTGVDSLIQDLS